ncbi:MAG TPA: hypothetical protein VK002_13945 [Rubricoccaceae bacterium]|nr:hypothetical protein [Rubricoccaceae bacterium]
MTHTPSRTDPDAEVRRRLAEAVPEDRLDAAWAAYEEARIAGLCHEGAWEAALGAAALPRREQRHP